jgi:hypothetical protein
MGPIGSLVRVKGVFIIYNEPNKQKQTKLHPKASKASPG